MFQLFCGAFTAENFLYFQKSLREIIDFSKDFEKLLRREIFQDFSDFPEVSTDFQEISTDFLENSTSSFHVKGSGAKLGCFHWRV